ncbi:MAG TPA: peptidoglycan DD-metalloendopeptidase family protein [Thermodesulfobacteriota bacterium]|nr:peptidoglycan DD-metalloendopeptidase family protein [Thermodesulfobacteriota bacterium]
MVVIWILLGWFLYPMTSNLWAAQAERVEKELSEKKEEFERIKKRLRLKQKEKEDILRKESLIRKNLNRMRKDLHKREKVLKQKRAGLDQIKTRICDTENRISILDRDVKQTEDRLSSGLQVLYKVTRVPLEPYLFSVPSSADLLRMDRYLRVLVEHHTQLMKAYKHELILNHRDEKKLVRNLVQWQQSIYEEEKKKEKVGKLRNAEQAKLKSTVNQIVTCQKSVTEIEKRSKLIQSLIGKLERERRVISYGKSKYGMLKGKLRLPVQGEVVSLFKERGQNGIEIEASIGSPVRAILPGKVVYADWFKGFMNLIIIDHGDGVFTIFGNCSKLIRKRGDTVSEGDIIAQMGSSESDGDCRLYFEIRHQGKPQDPLKWILSGKKKRP